MKSAVLYRRVSTVAQNGQTKFLLSRGYVASNCNWITVCKYWHWDTTIQVVGFTLSKYNVRKYLISIMLFLEALVTIRITVVQCKEGRQGENAHISPT